MRKMRIVIDITSLVEVTFVSGIQRVVREIVTRMVFRRTNENTQFLLVAYSLKRLNFYTVPTQLFLDCYQTGITGATALVDGEPFSFDGLGSGDVFFDLDSVWNNRMRRSFLLPVLKKQGVAIAVHIYDIIPILYPQYCDEQTTLRFMDYLGAHLLYADLVIANTESTLQDVRKLSEQIGTKPVPGVCSPLGANFVKGRTGFAAAEDISPQALALKDSRYLLMVGTVEPRKNHAFILDAYEESLRSAGFSLVIAGRRGWNVDALMERINELQKSDDHFLFLDSVNDNTIDYLYEHAFFTVFPTKQEGFGLPVIESFLHKTPVLASNIPVLREVGGDYCDYFSLDDKADLRKILLQYKNDPSSYSKQKARLGNYSPVSWDQSEDRMWNALDQLRKRE